MSINEYWHVQVFMLGLVSDVKFGAYWTMFTELITSFFMRNVKNGRCATATALLQKENFS